MRVRVRNAVVPGLGDGLILRQDAADWIKEQSKILALKPGWAGMSVDLKAALRRVRTWWRSR
jgi:hypothetical protein